MRRLENLSFENKDAGQDSRRDGAFQVLADHASPASSADDREIPLHEHDGDLASSRPVALTHAGPILPSQRAVMRVAQKKTYLPALTPQGRSTIRMMTGLWAAACGWLWLWWWQPEHMLSWIGIALNSLLLLYFTLLPAYFLVLVNRMRNVNPHLPVPALRTAILVTKAPSEPWEVAQRTLKAMLNQCFPHPYDVWLCDESPDDETLTWCQEYGIKVSSRKGVAEYNREHWPRRTRCKEGNVAYFYDNWGYRNYDVVVQLDCDHVPSPTYLAEMVRPFFDPAIGYVAAPSLNDTNSADSWTARGRLHREAPFHGPLQAGHSQGLAPSCIGSHYAVRTQALKSIGGIGPELAEDFSTSFLLTSAGWRSAFANMAEAHGEGPIDFSAMVTQEFQWARSLMTLLLETVPRHLRRLPWGLRARFMLSLSYYPFLSLAMCGGLILPVIAVIAGEPWVRVNYFDFLVHWAAMELCVLGVIDFLRSKGLLRPVAVPLISWENWLYMFSRWPYIAWGVLAALVQRVRPRKILFRVTPKSVHGLRPLNPYLISPYCIIAAVFAVVVIAGHERAGVLGYLFLCLLGAVCYSTVSIAVPLLHAWESARTSSMEFSKAVRETVIVPLVVALVPALLTAASFLCLFTRLVEAV